jgi:hypothetical protein
MQSDSVEQHQETVAPGTGRPSLFLAAHHFPHVAAASSAVDLASQGSSAETEPTDKRATNPACGTRPNLLPCWNGRFPFLEGPLLTTPVRRPGMRSMVASREGCANRASSRGSHPNMNAFVCECGDPDCASTISLSPPEYETVRASANHFVIAANHENPEVEWVLTETKRFAVVQTLVGEPSKVALRTDPRTSYSDSTRASS